MAHSSVIIDKRSAKKDGTYPVKIRVTHNGEFYISVGIDVFESQWKEIADTSTLKSKTGIVINHPIASRYNNLISSRKIEIDKYCCPVKTKNDIITLAELLLNGSSGYDFEKQAPLSQKVRASVAMNSAVR